LYSGNSLINSFFTINKTLSPNLTDHYLLALFNTVFRSTVSNKLLILIFFAGFPLCFRYIIKKYNPGGIALSSLSIPFTHCFLFYMGFYNFILSFTFILISIIYYLHHFLDTKDKYSAKEYIIFMFLVLLNYFTNGISFLYLGITCGLIELYKLSISRRENGVDRKLWVRHILLLVLIWLPGLVMLYIFNSKVAFPDSGTISKIPSGELLNGLYSLKCLCVFTEEDRVYTHFLFAVLMVLFCIAFCRRFRNGKPTRFLFSDIFIVMFAGTLICYFIIPDGAAIGMISDRLNFYLFIFLILWIALQNTFKIISLFLSVTFVTIHIIFFFKMHYNTLINLNNNIVAIQNASKSVNPNSILLPVNFENSWLEPHLFDYMGIDKPMVILASSEADLGWFAVNRNFHDMPKLLIPDNILNGIELGNIPPSNPKKYIDYFFVYGNYKDTINSNYLSGFKEMLDSYSPIYVSEDEKIHIFSYLGPFLFSLECGAEKLDSNKGRFVASNAELIDNADARDSTIKHTGNYSIKLNKDKIYGFTYHGKNFKNGDLLKITVWKYPALKDTGGLVVSCGKNFYKTVSTGEKNKSTGWEELEAYITVPEDNSNFSIYVMNDKPVNVWFDDLKIVRYPSR